jgi:outer membrane protein
LTRLQVTAAVGNYFFTVLTTQQAVAAAQANVDRWHVFDQSIHTLVDNTLRPGADASRADAQLALARTQLYQAQQAEQAAIATLASLIGAAGTEIRLDPGKLQDLPPIDSLPSAAPSANPLAQQQLASVRRAEAQDKALNRTDYPRLFLQAEGFGRGIEVPNSGSIIGNWNGLAPARGNCVAGLTITFPNLFDFKALSAEKQAATATEKSQQALYDKTIQDVTGGVRAALAQLKGTQLVAQQTPIELAAARASGTQSRALRREFGDSHGSGGSRGPSRTGTLLAIG